LRRKHTPSPSDWFDDVPVLARMTPDAAAGKLIEMGEDQAAASLLASASSGARSFGLRDMLGLDRGWKNSAHAFGHIENGPLEMLPIIQAGQVEPDLTLKNERIKISLGRLVAVDYPGAGKHVVLCDFYAQHQLPKEVEHLHYNTLVRVSEGQDAGVLNYPLFVGLKVGNEGVVFKGMTVNVKNVEDEAMLGFLESETFRTGLQLLNAVQPALAPFSVMAVSLTKAIAQRNRNVAVQEFQMGLDFVKQPYGACLREGAYVAVQIPKQLSQTWDWHDWTFDYKRGQVVKREAPDQGIPYNYVVVTVSRFSGS